MITHDEKTEILLVEDNDHDAELTLRALTKRHLANKVVHVKDGVEALDFLFCRGAYAHRDPTQHPKIVLLDMKLPKVDGLEVLRALKSNDATKTIPVVILTSSAEQRDILSSYQLGVNSYIVKPVDFENFSKAVSDLGCYWVLLNERPSS
jgi:two-component system response regulator